jgi:hypothetical protein
MDVWMVGLYEHQSRVPHTIKYMRNRVTEERNNPEFTIEERDLAVTE